MPIQINKQLGSVRIDVTTDPDHVAKYGLYLWRKLSNGQWEKLPDAITPPTSHTLDPADHTVNLPVENLHGLWLTLGAQVNSVTPNPLALELKIKVRQEPVPQGPAGTVDVYPVDCPAVVPPGQDLNLRAEYEFQVA